MPMSTSFARDQSQRTAVRLPASLAAVTVSDSPSPAIALAESADIDAATKSAEVVHVTSGQNTAWSTQLGMGIEVRYCAVSLPRQVAHVASWLDEGRDT